MRRTLSEFEALCSKLHVSPSVPVEFIDPQALETIAETINELLNDGSSMHNPELVAFVADEVNFVRSARPNGFWLPSTRPPRREFVAGLPMPYLKAAFVYFGLDAPVQTRFEYADVLLAHLEGRSVEFQCDESAGDGMRPVHALQDDLFDSLAIHRASEAVLPGSPFSSFPLSKPPEPEHDPNASADLAMTVPAYLAQLGLADKYLTHLTDMGFDDVRVLTRLLPNDLCDLGITPEDRDAMLSAALAWQAKAQASGVLQQWARMMLRSGERGLLSFATPKAKKGQPQSDGPEFVMRDAKGRIDYKLGDEVG